MLGRAHRHRHKRSLTVVKIVYCLQSFTQDGIVILLHVLLFIIYHPILHFPIFFFLRSLNLPAPPFSSSFSSSSSSFPFSSSFSILPSYVVLSFATLSYFFVLCIVLRCFVQKLQNCVQWENMISFSVSRSILVISLASM